MKRAFGLHFCIKWICLFRENAGVYILYWIWIQMLIRIRLAFTRERVGSQINKGLIDLCFFELTDDCRMCIKMGIRLNMLYALHQCKLDDDQQSNSNKFALWFCHYMNRHHINTLTRIDFKLDGYPCMCK